MKKMKALTAVILIVAFILSGCSVFDSAQRLAENITEAVNVYPTPSPTAEVYSETPSPSEPADDRPTADMRNFRNKNSNTGKAQPPDEWSPYDNPVEAADPDEEQLFTEYTNDLVGQIPMDLLDEIYFFTNPQAAGVEPVDLDVFTTYEEDHENFVETFTNIKEELEQFDPQKLSRKSALYYQLLIEAVENNLTVEDNYLISAALLGLSSTYLELPNLIAEAPVRNEQDIVDILTMISLLPDIYADYVDVEKERLKAGVGMHEHEIELVLDELDRIIKPRNNPVQQAIDEMIDGADFLTEQRKTELKQQNAQYIKEYYIPAYEYVRDELTQMEGRQGVPGLAGADGGADFYEIILKSAGIDMDPLEAQAYLLDEFYYYQDIISLILMSNPEFLEAYLNDDDTLSDITGGMTSQEIVEYLDKAVKEDFKDIGEISYTVEIVPESMAMPGAAAFYLLKALDAANSEPAVIYINDEDSDGDFITLAHEGFPGHMYQDAYQHLNGRPYAVDMLAQQYRVFVEGWGTYAQMTAADYAPKNPEYAYLLALDDMLNGLMYAYMDIGINYLGWDREDCVEELNDVFGITPDISEELVDFMLDYIPTDPGSLLSYYYGSAKLLELRRIAEEELGDKFNAVDFHNAILDVSPAPMYIIEAAVINYIDETQSGKTETDSDQKALDEAA